MLGVTNLFSHCPHERIRPPKESTKNLRDDTVTNLIYKDIKVQLVSSLKSFNRHYFVTAWISEWF